MSTEEIETLLNWDEEAPLLLNEKETYDEWEEKRRRKGEAVKLVLAQGRQITLTLISLALFLFIGCGPQQKAGNEIVTDPEGEVVFQDVVGGPWPTPFGVKILPSNGGPWTSHDTSPWFDTSPHNSGNAGDECILKPHTEALSAGVHSQVITFKSAGLPDKEMIVNVVMLTAPPSPPPAISQVSGVVSYCPAPSLPGVPGVTITAAGPVEEKATTGATGNFSLSLTTGANYTLTPTKAAVLTSSGINTMDAIAIQRHFLNIVLLPVGCPREAADTNDPPNGVSTLDSMAVQRFYLGLTESGIAQTGRYKFQPVNRSFTPLTGNPPSNFSVMVLGDPISSFVEPALPSTVNLAWNPSPVTPGQMPLAFYRVYSGVSQGVYSASQDVGLNTSASVAVLGNPTFFTVTAFNQVGIESTYSNEVRHP